MDRVLKTATRDIQYMLLRHTFRERPPLRREPRLVERPDGGKRTRITENQTAPPPTHVLS